MAWVLLVVAGLFEVAWAVGLKQSNGLTRPWPTVLTIAALVTSMVLLALAVRTIPIGTGYAVWVGIGALGTSIVGIVHFKEGVTPARLVFLGLLVVAIVGLKLASKEVRAGNGE
ncbi:MAG: multidrug efflux SMR transporter [Phycisphaerales bacterium]